jgi:hypothetical protein
MLYATAKQVSLTAGMGFRYTHPAALNLRRGQIMLADWVLIPEKINDHKQSTTMTMTSPRL